MRFRFSLITTVTCITLAVCMLCLSRWQWNRHLQKQELIKELQATLEREPVNLTELIDGSADWTTQTWRRVRFAGTFDFEREMIVRRNRGANDHAGFHVLTPLKLDNSDMSILIDRGFLPLGREARDFRTRYQLPARMEGYGIIKQSMPRKFLAPSDRPAGLDKPWVDVWVRVDVESMQRQIPFPLLPIYLETMENPDDPLLSNKIVKEGSASKGDVLALTSRQGVQNLGMDSPDAAYPVPLYDTTPPPDIHLGYVYEWAFMALLTLGIGVVMQFKRRA